MWNLTPKWDLAPLNKMTDSDDGMLSLDDDFPESDDDDDDDDEDAGVDDIDEDYIMTMEHEMEDSKPKAGEEEHPYEILTGDQVVELMQEIIREVNTIVQVRHNVVTAGGIRVDLVQ